MALKFAVLVVLVQGSGGLTHDYTTFASSPKLGLSQDIVRFGHDLVWGQPVIMTRIRNCPGTHKT